jgi:hypothetical protein
VLQEAVASRERIQELGDFNAALAGHANHKQKISYLTKLQSDYNSVVQVGVGKKNKQQTRKQTNKTTKKQLCMYSTLLLRIVFIKK